MLGAWKFFILFFWGICHANKNIWVRRLSFFWLIGENMIKGKLTLLFSWLNKKCQHFKKSVNKTYWHLKNLCQFLLQTILLKVIQSYWHKKYIFFFLIWCSCITFNPRPYFYISFEYASWAYIPCKESFHTETEMTF